MGRKARLHLWVPPVPELVSPLTTAIPLQLLAYHMADLRGHSRTVRLSTLLPLPFDAGHL